VVCHRQHFYFSVALRGWVLDVPLTIVHPTVLHTKLHHHSQYDEHVFHRFNAEPGVEFLQHKFLY